MSDCEIYYGSEMIKEGRLCCGCERNECVIYLFFQPLYDWVRDSDCYKAQPVLGGDDDMIDNTGDRENE